MKTAPWFTILAILAPAFLTAAEVEAIPADMVQKLAPQLLEQAAKGDQSIKIDGDAEKANGFHIPGKIGALIVPQKDLKESEELAAKFKTESGAPLAYLFLFNIAPISDSKRIDASKLREVTLTLENGNSHTVHVLLLAIRQLSDDDYRLHVYGTDKKPFVDVKFAEGQGPGPEPVAVELKDANETTREGKIVVTVFGKYQASFPAGYSGE